MKSEKFAWTVSVMLIALLAFQLPGTFAQRDDDYAFVRTLVDIHRQVARNYVDPVNEGTLRTGAINGLLNELDPFSTFVPPERQEEFDRMLDGSFKGVGIQLDQKDNGQIEVITPIDGSPAFKAGVMAGDIIIKVNGESIEGVRLPDVIKKITGPLGSEVTLTVRRVTGESVDLTMTREEIIVPTLKGYDRKDDNSWNYYVMGDPKIAYLRLTQFTPDSIAPIKAILGELLNDGMKGLILDLRFNPGGRLDEAVNIVDLFIDDGVIVSTKGRNRPENVQRATVGGTLPYFPLIVLVNEFSASASEIVAGSLKDNQRALIIGERTYGKGSVQELIPLENKGGELKLTVAYYYLPSGRLVHRKKDATDWGVEPHIKVAMDTTAQRDAVLGRDQREYFRKPGDTTPTSQPVDAQLQRAVDTMIALVILQGERNDRGELKIPPMEIPSAPQVNAPATQPVGNAPATQPATLPVAAAR